MQPRLCSYDNTCMWLKHWRAKGGGGQLPAMGGRTQLAKFGLRQGGGDLETKTGRCVLLLVSAIGQGKEAQLSQVRMQMKDTRSHGRGNIRSS